MSTDYMQDGVQNAEDKVDDTHLISGVFLVEEQAN